MEKKIIKIINQMTLEEQVALMSGATSQEEVSGAIHNKRKTHYNEFPYKAGGNERLNIPPIFFADGTRGVVCGVGINTCFPVALLRGATFNKKLEERIGEAIAKEVQNMGGNFFAGICVNVPYHPGWGRGQEVYGEDTYLLGEMGAACVRGIQREGIIACVKHFAFNSMENARFHISIISSKRSEREVYLPQFKKCIDAGAKAIMSAYNKYNGILCGENSYLLNRILKKEWAFDGIVVSDFNWGIKDTVCAIHGGMDIEMPNTRVYGDKLIDAIKMNKVEKKYVENAAYRIVKTMLHIDKNDEIDKEKCYKKHHELSLECAREGIVLIRNEENKLPLKIGRKKRNIAIIGKMADEEVIGDRGSSQVYPPYVVTVLQGIKNYGNANEIIYYRGENIEHCKKLAMSTDEIIIVVGNTYAEEGEFIRTISNEANKIGGDRINGLELLEQQQEIILAVSDIRKDAIVVVTGGGMIEMQKWHKKVSSILVVFYPGMEGGNAIGEIIFGKTNPSGKLPFVIAESIKQLPRIDWSAEEQVYEYYYGYTLLDKNKEKPLYPFGFGLSFTTFIYDIIKIKQSRDKIFVEVIIKNTGTKNGAEVIQVYIGVKESIVERPKKLLKAFEKVKLKQKEEKVITLVCDINEMAYYCVNKEKMIIESAIYEIYVGNSSMDKSMKKKEFFINIEKNDRVKPETGVY